MKREFTDDRLAYTSLARRGSLRVQTRANFVTLLRRFVTSQWRWFEVRTAYFVRTSKGECCFEAHAVLVPFEFRNLPQGRQLVPVPVQFASNVEILRISGSNRSQTEAGGRDV